MSNPNSISEKRTIVEEGTTFKGTLSSNCPIDVRGSIEGDVETPTLVVSESGAVHGKAKVGQVHSEGTISGEFEAESVELAGSVKDNTIIRARSLEVRLSKERGKLQVIFGDCELSIGDEPTERVMTDDQPDIAPQVAAPEPQVEAPAAAAPAAVEEVVEERPITPFEAAIREQLGLRESEATESITTSSEASDSAASTKQSADAASNESADSTESQTDGTDGKRRGRKGKNGAEEGKHWSHPPSQPPPAS